MASIGFYHLTRTAAEEALPALLARTLAAGQRAVVRCGSEARLAVIDQALWSAAEWLPHGVTLPALQPIWLTLHDDAAEWVANGAPNGGAYLLLVDGVGSARLSAFERVFDLFDGNDADAVVAARGRWSAAKGAGHEMAYWQQGASGWTKAG